MIHSIDFREGRLTSVSFNSPQNISLRSYTIRKMTYFANACRFSIYLKYSFNDFRMYSPQFRPFLNWRLRGSWRLFKLCALLLYRTITQNKGLKHNKSNKKESFRAHPKMAAAFKSPNGRLVQRLLSSTIVSMRVRQNTESLL